MYSLRKSLQRRTYLMHVTDEAAADQFIAAANAFRMQKMGTDIPYDTKNSVFWSRDGTDPTQGKKPVKHLKKQRLSNDSS
jgi:hypothetical protein